jgi:hypothetical protein
MAYSRCHVQPVAYGCQLGVRKRVRVTNPHLFTNLEVLDYCVSVVQSRLNI